MVTRKRMEKILVVAIVGLAICTTTGVASALTSDTVVLSTTIDYPDAYVADAAAHHIGVPLLWTDVYTIPLETQAALDELQPDTIYIIGGPVFVSSDVENALKAQGYTVIRIWGITRYGTSTEVAKYFWPQAEGGAATVVMIADTVGTPDDGNPETTTQAVRIAKANDAPLIVTAKDCLPAMVRETLVYLLTQKVILVLKDDFSEDVYIELRGLSLQIIRDSEVPIADAGADQPVYVGDLVTLDGSASWDPDSDPLTYSWTFTSRPAGSTATLANPTSVNPTFNVDLPGTYVIDLTVNDGTVSSGPDTVSVSTINVAPIADAGDDQSVYVGDLVTLDGSGSTDSDGDPLTFNWAFTARPSESTAILDVSNPVAPTFTADVAGTYVVSLTVNDGTVNSDPASTSISAVTQQTEVISKVQDEIVAINELDQENFNNPNNKKALTNKLNAVLESLDNGEYQDALNKLKNDVLKKTDGCALTGTPDKNDWILDCESQAVVYPLLVDAIEFLEQL